MNEANQAYNKYVFVYHTSIFFWKYERI